MSKSYIIAIALASALGITACSSTGETIGTVGGAAAGGIIGHELGRRYEDRH